MNSRGILYIAAVAIVALTIAILLAVSAPHDIRGFRDISGIVSFSLVALIAEGSATNFRVGGGTRQPQSSLAILPFIGSILLFPAPVSVLSIAVVNALSQAVIKKKDPARVVFNVSQGIICSAAAYYVYTSVSGRMPGGNLSIWGFVPMVLTFFVTNILLTSAGIALLRSLPFRQVLATVAGPGGANLVYDVLVSPIALLPVVLYEATHVLGLFLTVTPLLVLRRSYSTSADLEAANQDLLTVLVKAIETRDPYTSGHSRRVASLARLIAEDMNLRRPVVEDVARAALLHDIGKIDADYATVIRKPHDLTEEERILIQTHAVKGAELLESLSSVRNRVIEAVRHHHERYDGKGYPSGLAGEDIPIAARIIMICDSVDAMLSDRPYRKALTMDRVRSELSRCSSSQFDPHIVDVMLRRGTLERAAALVSAEQKEERDVGVAAALA